MYLYLIIAIIVVVAILFILPKSTGKKPNPIAEADVYLAYGRKEQAKQVLKSALELNPNDSDLKKKLDSIQL